MGLTDWFEAQYHPRGLAHRSRAAVHQLQRVCAPSKSRDGLTERKISRHVKGESVEQRSDDEGAIASRAPKGSK